MLIPFQWDLDPLPAWTRTRAIAAVPTYLNLDDSTHVGSCMAAAEVEVRRRKKKETKLMMVEKQEELE
eukprot:7246587-Pyramimonas_sp.AAC.3